MFLTFLEIEQVESDLYDDFATRKKQKIKKQEQRHKIEPVKEKPTIYSNKNKNYMKSEDNFPSLIIRQPDKIITQKENSKLKSLLNEKIEPTSSKSQVIEETKITKQQSKNQTDISYVKKESKLSSLLVENLNTKPKPKVDIFKNSINKNKIDYEEEFPEL